MCLCLHFFPYILFILCTHFSVNLPSSSYCHPFFAHSFLPSLNHPLLLYFSFSIFIHSLLFLIHFICLCHALLLLSSFVTPVCLFLCFSFALFLLLNLPLRLSASFHFLSFHLAFHILIHLSVAFHMPLALFFFLLTQSPTLGKHLGLLLLLVGLYN